MGRQTLHKLRNLVHSALLILGMALIAGACAWTLWGWTGVLWAFGGVAFAILLSPSIPPGLILRLYQAQPLTSAAFPRGHAALREIAERAQLPVMPRLYYVPSALLNAFAVGGPRSAAIAITDGMLRKLTLRELVGVMAHEVSHIANNDLWIMNIADVLSRATSILSYLGMFLLLMNLPLLIAGAGTVPWLLVLLLVFAPTIMGLLQLALSRAREFDADFDAARLTGDPSGLASALAKLERLQGRFWEEILFPGRRIPEPSVLRTHPPTEERIRRLLELREPVSDFPISLSPDRISAPAGLRIVREVPRWRGSGYWY